MTTVQEVQKRNNKAQHLRVIQVEDGDYFVSSEEGKILYKVTCGDGKENSCTCGDFAKGSKADPQFTCKHILSVMQCETDAEKAKYLEKTQPKLDPRFVVQIDNRSWCPGPRSSAPPRRTAGPSPPGGPGPSAPRWRE